MSKQIVLSYCGEQVRAQDGDKYLWCLSFPPEAREAMFAIVAFAGEVPRIPSVASEPMIGHIRFAWWREALGEIFGGEKVRKHPVAEALKEVVAAHALPRAPFDVFLDAREQDYATTAYENYEALADFAINSNYPLLELALIVLGRNDEAQQAQARRAAYLYGMTGIVRAVLHQPVLMEKTLPFLLHEHHNGKEHSEGEAPHAHSVGEAICALVACMDKELISLETNAKPVLVTRLMSLIGNHFLRKIRAGGQQVSSLRVESARGWLVCKVMLCITFATS